MLSRLPASPHQQEVLQHLKQPPHRQQTATELVVAKVEETVRPVVYVCHFKGKAEYRRKIS